MYKNKWELGFCISGRSFIQKAYFDQGVLKKSKLSSKDLTMIKKKTKPKKSEWGLCWSQIPSV